MLSDIFGLLLKMAFFVKLLWIPFGQPLEKIGLLFTRASGHTDCGYVASAFLFQFWRYEFETFRRPYVYHENSIIKNRTRQGGSRGLVVMGGDSYSKCRGFKSRRRMLDGHDIFHIDLL